MAASGSTRRPSTASPGDGVLFTNAFTSNPKCSPCRATILTGPQLLANEGSGESLQHLPARLPVYPDAARKAAGYFVGLTGKGLGSRRFQVHRLAAQPCRPVLRQAHTEASDLRHLGQSTTPRNFEDFLEQTPRRSTVLLLAGRSGAAPRLRARLGSARRQETRRRPPARLLSRQPHHPQRPPRLRRRGGVVRPAPRPGPGSARRASANSTTRWC